MSELISEFSQSEPQNLFEKKGRVLSFEPETTNFELLKYNASRNICSNVSPFNMALGEKQDVAKLNVYRLKGDN
jgi:FkbM family methyltransferase